MLLLLMPPLFLLALFAIVVIIVIVITGSVLVNTVHQYPKQWGSNGSKVVYGYPEPIFKRYTGFYNSLWVELPRRVITAISSGSPDSLSPPASAITLVRVIPSRYLNT
ncbi:MAG: hypothetical protein DRP32_03800, partial [Thermotogae bacterium]